MKRAADSIAASASQLSLEDEESTQEEQSSENLPQLLRKKQKNLEEREAELERRIAAFEKGSGQFKRPCDVLHLNVGGTLTAVLRKTLTSVEGSMLASRFSGRWDDSLEKDKDGNFFIDQPMELFGPMIDYLRAKACETALAPPVTTPDFENEKKRRDFVRMVEYFGRFLSSFIFVFKAFATFLLTFALCRNDSRCLSNRDGNVPG